jgi:hypothetical protein
MESGVHDYARRSMATVELTLEQLREAIIQLPELERRRLLDDIQRLPSADGARRLAREVRGTFRMNAKDRVRMSELLEKANEGNSRLPKAES